MVPVVMILSGILISFGPVGMIITVLSGTLVKRIWLSIAIPFIWQLITFGIPNYRPVHGLSFNYIDILRFISVIVVAAALNILSNRFRNQTVAPPPAYIDDEEDEDKW